MLRTRRTRYCVTCKLYNFTWSFFLSKGPYVSAVFALYTILWILSCCWLVDTNHKISERAISADSYSITWVTSILTFPFPAGPKSSNHLPKGLKMPLGTFNWINKKRGQTNHKTTVTLFHLILCQVILAH